MSVCLCVSVRVTEGNDLEDCPVTKDGRLAECMASVTAMFNKTLRYTDDQLPEICKSVVTVAAAAPTTPVPEPVKPVVVLLVAEVVFVVVLVVIV